MRTCLIILLLASLTDFVRGDEVPVPDTARGDRMIAAYFQAETHKLADRSLADIHTAEDWQRHKDEYRRQLLEMLGLDPCPEKTDLKATVTGTVDHELFTVEKLHFQSRPGLYVTGNLYIPKGLKEPAPAILYVCGHGRVFKDGVSYGNKTHYQHHGGWFARHGYVCLIIDTVQLGEIEGVHHGTYNLDMWWWNARGYTPAGVEAWNCIRALDYLETRKEVDPKRFGVSGRSGGGAYSWWIAAIDDRIQVAVPVAGITDLENHVIDGVIEGHCDCMFMVNTYRWDYSQVAALVAPRPLLISNTDKDPIFPLEGVVRIHDKVRRIYRLNDAGDKLGLQITEGPHLDAQELHIHAFHWFNRFLKGGTTPIEKPAVSFFEPEQLKVFERNPPDEINTTIHETFVPLAETPTIPENAEAWSAQRDAWLTGLREKSFRGWPEEGEPLDMKEAFSAERESLRLAGYDFISQQNIPLRLYVLHKAGLESPELVVLNALDEQDWREWLANVRTAFADELSDEIAVEADGEAFASLQKMFTSFPWAMAYVAPRGVGPTVWDQAPKKQIQNRRRFMMLGQTLEGMQVWDVRRAAQALRGLPSLQKTPLWLQGKRQTAGIALYASLFEPDIARLDLWELPPSHREGPNFLNVMRYLDTPQAVAMAAERSNLRLYQSDESGWEYPQAVAAKLAWSAKRVQIRKPPTADGN